MKFTILKKIILSQLLFLLVASSYSQKTDTTILKRTYQTAFTKTAPVIDGLGNDESWNLVDWTSNFIQSQPIERINHLHSRQPLKYFMIMITSICSFVVLILNQIR